MNLASSLVVVTLLMVVVVLSAWAAGARKRGRGPHATNLRDLLRAADQLEADLMACRRRLQQAHAVMSTQPDQPALAEQLANAAVTEGLRALLRQRLWIRDEAPRARAAALHAAAQALRGQHEKLKPLLHSLEQAQHELDRAVRGHLPQ